MIQTIYSFLLKNESLSIDFCREIRIDVLYLTKTIYCIKNNASLTLLINTFFQLTYIQKLADLLN